MNLPYQTERLSDSISVCVTPQHKFGTDAFLLAHFASPRQKDIVCDLGTGCGIIPLLMIRDCHPQKIYALDIQPLAIDQLTVSLSMSGLTAFIEPICADLKNWNGASNGTLDVITCNPPYKAPGTGILSDTQSDQIARHETRCTLDDICQTAGRLLKFGGKLCLCQRPERLCDVISAMKNASIEPKRLRFVAKTASHAPWLFLIEGKKGGKPFLKVEPTLAVYEGSDFSKEMSEIYGWGKQDKI